MLLLPVPAGALSCVRYVFNKTGAPLVDAKWYSNFPRTVIAVGTVAIFKYRSGISHVALVERLDADGFLVSECNYDGEGGCGKRFVPYNHYSIVGFWEPPTRKNSYRGMALFPSEAAPNILDKRSLTLLRQ